MSSAVLNFANGNFFNEFLSQPKVTFISLGRPIKKNQEDFMKLTFTLIMSFFLSFTLSAAGINDSKLSVTVAGSGSIQVLVDNQRYQQTNNTVMISNLEPGRHTIQVYKMRSGNRSIFNRNRTDQSELLYSTTINVRPRQFIDVVINRFGKALVDERSLMAYNEEDDRYDDYYYDRNDDYNNYKAVSEQEFSQMREQLKRQHFENARLEMARQLVDKNYLSSRQVHVLLELFSFENNKLELAKAAYRNTTDKNNYYQVYDVFSFDRSRQELTQHIERFKR